MGVKAIMLSRVAENLFWIGRYIERAENIARLVDAAARMSALPEEVGRAPSNEWSSILIAAGVQHVFDGDVKTADAFQAAHHLLFDAKNPSSVINCITAARENARAVRFALTKDCWEALNGAWAESRLYDPSLYSGERLPDMVDWVKQKSALFRGGLYGSLLQDDGFSFLRLGITIERTDSIARLLDVKYHILLPSLRDVGSFSDHYEWLSLLQASAAQRAYMTVKRSDVTARGVTEFLILEPQYPRSIYFNVNRTLDIVDELENFYGQRIDGYQEIEAFRNYFHGSTIDSIIDYGLHEFLTDTIKRNYGIADVLAKAYSFHPILTDDLEDTGTSFQ